MGENLVEMALGSTVVAILSLFLIAFISAVSETSLKPQPGDPFYDAYISLIAAIPVAVGLFTVAGAIGIFLWMRSQF